MDCGALLLDLAMPEMYQKKINHPQKKTKKGGRQQKNYLSC